MISNIIVVILAIILWILFGKYQSIRYQYFELLRRDSDFISFVKNAVNTTSDEARCIKIINKKYRIGILNAKKIIEKVKQMSGII